MLVCTQGHLHRDGTNDITNRCPQRIGSDNIEGRIEITYCGELLREATTAEIVEYSDLYRIPKNQASLVTE